LVTNIIGGKSFDEELARSRSSSPIRISTM